MLWTLGHTNHTHNLDYSTVLRNTFIITFSVNKKVNGFKNVEEENN